MKKLILSLLIGMFLISFSSAYSYEVLTNYAKCGANCKVLRFDNPDEMAFRTYLLSNTEVHNGKANMTYKNYTNVFTLNYHIYYNNTNEDLYWDNLALYWDGLSSNINESMGMFMYENGTRMHFYKLATGITTNLETNTGKFLFTTARHQNISVATNSRDYTSSSAVQVQVNITDDFIEFDACNQMSLTTNRTHLIDNDVDRIINNQFLNGSLYQTSWFDSSPMYYIFFNNTGGAKVGVSQVFSESSLMRTKTALSVSMIDSVFIDYSQDAGVGGYCLIGSTSVVTNNSFEGARMYCDSLAYGFLTGMNMDFLDSENLQGTMSVTGFLGDVIARIKYTLDYFFKDRNGNNINATYTIIDAFGNNYNGTTNHMQQVITAEQHYAFGFGSYIYTNYRPMNFSANASNYFTISNYSINTTFKNRGIMPLQEIPYSIKLNPQSSFRLGM